MFLTSNLSNDICSYFNDIFLNYSIETECVFQNGMGIGKSEEITGARNKDECRDRCVITYSKNVKGVMWYGKSCYCMLEMTSIDLQKRGRTCWLKVGGMTRLLLFSLSNISDQCVMLNNIGLCYILLVCVIQPQSQHLDLAPFYVILTVLFLY